VSSVEVLECGNCNIDLRVSLTGAAAFCVSILLDSVSSAPTAVIFPNAVSYNKILAFSTMIDSENAPTAATLRATAGVVKSA
jgi:hypothetical protein